MHSQYCINGFEGILKSDILKYFLLFPDVVFNKYEAS